MFQIPSTSPYASTVNPQISNMQQIETITGKANAAAYMYTQAVSAFPGDPNAGAVNGSLQWNALTETQKLIYLAATLPATFAGANIPADLVAEIQANAGPADFWNASYQQAGVVPGVQGLLSSADGMIPGTTQRVTVLILPTT